jgi:MarR family transcriptional regulator, 2-MHQ and catechol-resistance regulon repressor
MRAEKNPEMQQDLSAVHLWLVLWKASRAVQANAQRSIARHGMVESDFGVLEALLHRGPLSAKALGAKVLLTSGSMTAAVDRLAARGLVRREADAEDRRACIVRLTAAGERLIRRAFAQHRAEMETALVEFSITEREALLPLLRRLGRLAESRLTAGPGDEDARDAADKRDGRRTTNRAARQAASQTGRRSSK